MPATPKYLNSPETALFHKGRELYGLWQARQSAQKLKRLVVVEGYMDVVALAQHGVTRRWPRSAPRPRRSTPSCCSATPSDVVSASTATAPGARPRGAHWNRCCRG
jgi:hypothetical protein